MDKEKKSKLKTFQSKIHPITIPEPEEYVFPKNTFVKKYKTDKNNDETTTCSCCCFKF